MYVESDLTFCRRYSYDMLRSRGSRRTIVGILSDEPTLPTLPGLFKPSSSNDITPD